MAPISLNFVSLIPRSITALAAKIGLNPSTTERESPWRAEVLSREALTELGLELAEAHRGTFGPGRSTRLLESYRNNREVLKRVYQCLAEAAHKGESLTAGSEWMLDNYHVVERHIAAIKRYLPWSFYRTLPKFTSGSLRGFPRIYSLALEFIVHTDAALDANLAAVFISSYQQKLELSSGELWAFPIMLRFALFENLRRLMREAEAELLARRDVFALVDSVLGDESKPGTEIMNELARRLAERESFLPHGALELMKRLRVRGRKAFLALQFIEETLRERGLDYEELQRTQDHVQAARQISVGNTLTSLTAIDQMNWRDWFEGVSLSDQILRNDPARTYQRCDFSTRDAIRHQIEKISKRLNITDSAVAAAALACAQAAAHEHPDFDNESLCRKYVGSFFVGDGRQALEAKLGYRSSLTARTIRALEKRAFATYFTAISIATACLMGYVLLISEWAEVSVWMVITTLAISLLPMSELGSSLIQYLTTRCVPPRPLPRLSFEGKIPEGLDTLVTVHTIFHSTSSIQRAIDGLEVRFLANDDPAFTYILMADLPDAANEHTPLDQELIGIAQDGINTLNLRHASNGPTRFALFFRRRLWNESEQRWMAWERKRGKIEELNRFILGDDSTTLRLIVGDPAQIRKAKYVITLDSDTAFGRDVAKKLVATIHHPLNQPVIDPKIGRIVRGYGLIQPRVTMSLTSATSSRFSQLFSGQAGLDPYTNVVSDVYQDLFAEGSFVGKGIYQVSAFESVLAHKVPENTLLSHDLFEGSFARVGLASDIELYDDFPTRYMAYAKRLHRWVRGDWQLLPWLLPSWMTGHRVPRSNLSALHKWKMIDNLRRSLLAPTCLAAIVGGWLFLPGGPLCWTVIVLLVIAFPVLTGLASVFALPTVGISLGGFLGDIGLDLWRNAARSFCAICFLPHQAALMIDAIVRTLTRVFITHRHLLEWEPAERTERRTKNELRDFITLVTPYLAITSGLAAYAGYTDPSTLPFSIPLTLLWIASPFVAKKISTPLEAVKTTVSSSDRHYLREAAFDTWQFFNHHLREEYNYLMPDNLQMVPQEVIAERTSPTNLSLSILSVFSAYDLGFIPLHRAVYRSSMTLATMSRMERYRGHLFNWYAIRTLAPLSPRYISTVDSGNLLGHLYTLRTILEGAHSMPYVGEHHKSALLSRIEAALRDKNVLSDEDTSILTTLNAALRSCRSGDTIGWLSIAHDHSQFLERISKLHVPNNNERHTAIVKLAAIAEDLIHILPLIGWLHPIEKLRRHCESCAKSEHPALAQIAARANNITQSFTRASLTHESLRSIFEQIDELLEQARDQVPDEILGEVLTALNAARKTIDECEAALTTMSEQVTDFIEGMDFSFLYDEYRSLFTIGYNAEHAKKDLSFYDLLASEARLLSFLAVARGEVPQKHWFSLGRSLASTPGGKALISWSGTMFEYLMPFLVMKDFPTTILGRTGRAIVEAQIQYAKRQSVPWGISESAYSGVDFEKTYQYRAFGVPGLGLKRGLSEDLVISPYSTFLALPYAPSVENCILNLRRIEQEGGRGIYGFYESVDYTPGRSLRAEGKHIVQSFFAHHQGMSLVSVNNVINDDIMVDRFHAQPVVKSAELLLHEKFPDRVAAIVPHEPELKTIIVEEAPKVEAGLEVLTSPHSTAPRVRVLSNGRYSVMVDSAGGGFSFFNRTAMLTRWRDDPTATPHGSFIYIKDLKDGALWSSAYQPTKVEAESYEAIFSPGRAEFKRFDDKIFVHTEITVAPEDDVELRRVTVTNLGDVERELEITSYLEPVLLSRQGDAAHPAFSKLFIGAEVLKDADAILCSRRPRTENEEELFLFHRVTLRTSYAPIRFETSRADFIGRNGSMQEPARFAAQNSSTIETAHTHAANVDPIASLGCKVRLAGGASETIVFITGAAKSRRDALTLVDRYQELMHVSRAFELSWSRAQVELRSHAYTAAQADLFHRLAGCLFHNEESVRGPAELIMANRLPQSGLWRFGISGDLPIVLVKINDSRQGRVAQDLLLAHHFLRERCIDLDLVILYQDQGSYLQHLADDLRDIVRLSPAGYLLDRPGGVFLRSTAQISEAEIALLNTVAKVVIDAEMGGLAEALKTSAFEQLAPLPAPVARKRNPGQVRKQPALVYYNGIGGFSPESNAYVMPRHGVSKPPLPWSNVISNPNFGFIVTDSGSGYTWSENSRENRLTSWSNDPVLDPASEALFIRRSEHGDYWSLTPAPAGDGLEYKVTHEFGFSTFESSNCGISSKLTISGAVNDRVKWYSVTLTNHEASEQKLEMYFYADLVLGVTRENSYRFITTSFDRSGQALCAVNHYNNEFAGRVVSIGSTEPIVGYSGSRLEFLGRNGDLSRPAALERGAAVAFFPAKPKPIKLSGRVGAGIDPCAVIQVSVALKAREERTLNFYIGESPNLETMRGDVVRFRSPATQRAELTAVQTMWRDLLGAIQVKTPVDSFNIMMNGWFLYQTLSCRLFGRSGFYQSGGALGFRDQLQDSLALLPIKPESVRAQILLHAEHQFLEGDVQHWWHPPLGRGVRTRISDDLLWLPYAVSSYIEATGDYSILDVSVSYLRGAPLADEQMETYFIPELKGGEGTILEHCLLTLKVTEAIGAHGLPLIGSGDWNDGMNEIGRHGQGESVWLAWFQIEVLRRFAPLLDAQGDHNKAQELRERAERLRIAVEAHGWDGEWYRRAFYDDGTPLGSASNDECKIDSLAQSWSIISAAAAPERAVQAIESAQRYLVDGEAKLIKLLTPAFNLSEKNPGYIKGYPPGVRENGGQYTHASAWLIIANALLGNGHRAFELFDLINPINITAEQHGVTTYQAEPYVMCGDVYSEGALRGRAGWSWYTGSSGWLYQAGLTYILGLRIYPNHLSVNPCIPADWSETSLTYKHGARTFIVTINNAAGVERGVRSVSINGQIQEGQIIPLESPEYHERVEVIVEMGG